EYRPEHQDRGDRREHELEVRERRRREVERRTGGYQGDARLPLLADMTEDVAWYADHVREEPVVRTEDVQRVPERHLEADQHPRNEHEGERDERHHHRVDRPAL